MLNSCNKERQIDSKTIDNAFWSEEDLKVQNTILKFEDKIKNNRFKNGESMELDSVLWNIENLFNYNYSISDSSFQKLTIDSSFSLDISVNNNNMVDFTEISEVVYSFEAHLLAFLDQITDNEKFVIASDIALIENNFKSNVKTIQATIWYGSAYLPNSPCFPPFEDNEYWMWGLDFGGCGQNSATSSDAAKKLDYKLNHPRCYIQDNTNTFIGSTVTVSMYDPRIEYINVDDDYPNDGWLDYYGYWKDVSNLTTEGCMNPEEMNFYLQGALHIIETELQKIHDNNPGESWKFLAIDVNGELIPGGTTTIFHGMDIIYGKREAYINPIE